MMIEKKSFSERKNSIHIFFSRAHNRFLEFDEASDGVQVLNLKAIEKTFYSLFQTCSAFL